MSAKALPLLTRHDRTGNLSPHNRARGPWTLRAGLNADELDPSRHELIADVKAVTLHRFCMEKTPAGWEAFVILDV